jgi:Polyketide synthase dehydratase
VAWPAPARHPLLLRASLLQPALCVEMRVPLRAARLAVFGEHRVAGLAVLPGSAYLELVAAAASASVAGQGGAFALAAAALLAPLTLGDGAASVTCQIQLAPGLVSVSSSMQAGKSSAHLSGALTAVLWHTEQHKRPLRCSLGAWPRPPAAAGEPSAAASITGAPGGSTGYAVDPMALDSCLHLGTTLPGAATLQQGSYVPTGLQVGFHRPTVHTVAESDNRLGL